MIIYLHGFNSTGNSAKGQAIKHSFASEIDVHTPTYHFNPSVAIIELTGYIKGKIEEKNNIKPVMIIGSSLGGYYAQYLARQFDNVKVVLINPALGPIDTLNSHLGENENFYTGKKYILHQQHLDMLHDYNVDSPCSDNIETLLLIDKADEVIDYRYAYQKYQSCAETILYENGDHQFQHLAEAIPAIRNFYFDLA